MGHSISYYKERIKKYKEELYALDQRRIKENRALRRKLRAIRELTKPSS